MSKYLYAGIFIFLTTIAILMYFIHKKHGKSNRKLFGQGQGGYGEKNHPHPHPTNLHP